MRRLRAGLTAFGLVTSAAAIGQPQAALETLSRDPANWAMPAGGYASTRYSSLDQINARNVQALAPAWSFSTGVLRGHEGAPLVVGDVMFVHTPFPNFVYALDLDHDGRILWKYAPQLDAGVIGVMCCDTVNRGLAYGDGKLFLYRADATLVALDARTGKVEWSAGDGDQKLGETGTAAPLVVKDKVIVGNSGGEFGARGKITAYAVSDGKMIWRAYSTGPDADMLVDAERTTMLGKPVGPGSSLKSWQGDQWKSGGGAAWGWFSYDPDLNLIFYGTGNPSTWNPSQRPGDNKYAASIFARDVDTGVARWVYQTTPHDEWDYDGVNEMILVDQVVGGKKVSALAHFDRNGFAYLLDRTNGALLAAEKFDAAVNWADGVDMDPASPAYGRPRVQAKFSPGHNGEDETTQGICPAALGVKDEQPAAYSPRTGLFYVPTNHVCMDDEPFHVSYAPGQPYVGATLTMYPGPGGGDTGAFIAWDATKGRIAWSIPEKFSVWSGALATAGDVVFYGTLEGFLKAVDARTGQLLYKFKTPSGIIGNVMTYEHRGRQYVAVLSGVGGWPGIGLAAGLTDPHDGDGAVGGYASLSTYTSLGGVLTVFALPQ